METFFLSSRRRVRGGAVLLPGERQGVDVGGKEIVVGGNTGR
jgi:hypothetical protein